MLRPGKEWQIYSRRKLPIMRAEIVTSGSPAECPKSPAKHSPSPGRTGKAQVRWRNAFRDQSLVLPVLPTLRTLPFIEIVGNVWGMCSFPCWGSARFPREFPETGRQVGQVGQPFDIIKEIFRRGRAAVLPQVGRVRGYPSIAPAAGRRRAGVDPIPTSTSLLPPSPEF